MIIVAVGFEVFDEVVDSGVGVGEGVGEFDDLGFGLVDFESEPVDGEGGVVVGGVVEEGAAEGGAGGWWWVGGGVGDGFGGGDAVDAVFGFEESVEAAAGADVVVGEVELVEFGVVVVVGFEAECGVVGGEEVEFDGPVDVVVDGGDVAGFDGVEGGVPEVEGVGEFGVGGAAGFFAVGEPFGGGVEVALLEFEGGCGGAGCGGDGGLAGEVAGYGADGGHVVGEFEVG